MWRVLLTFEVLIDDKEKKRVADIFDNVVGGLSSGRKLCVEELSRDINCTQVVSFAFERFAGVGIGAKEFGKGKKEYSEEEEIICLDD
jgi:hypothetical protein